MPDSKSSSTPNSEIALSLSDDAPCHLKRLPAEIRNHICQFVATEDEPIQLSIRSNTWGKPPTPALSDPNTYLAGLALAQTCHQFRSEVLPLICEVNTIALDLSTERGLQPGAVPKFLSKIPHLIIHVDDYDDECVLFNAGQIHIKQRSGFVVEVTASGYLQHRCICALEELAGRCKGRDCMGRFVRNMECKGLRALYGGSKWDTEKTGLVCGSCEKEKTPPVPSTAGFRECEYF